MKTGAEGREEQWGKKEVSGPRGPFGPLGPLGSPGSLDLLGPLVLWAPSLWSSAPLGPLDPCPLDLVPTGPWAPLVPQATG